MIRRWTRRSVLEAEEVDSGFGIHGSLVDSLFGFRSFQSAKHRRPKPKASDRQAYAKRMLQRYC